MNTRTTHPTQYGTWLHKQQSLVHFLSTLQKIDINQIGMTKSRFISSYFNCNSLLRFYDTIEHLMVYSKASEDKNELV